MKRKLSDFFTRKVANEGKKLPLYAPDGEMTDEWLLIRGIDSDEFRKAEAKGRRRAIEVGQTRNADKILEALEETQLETIASLVADWSFSEKCTPQNVVNALREAPQLVTAINNFAGKRANFFTKG